MCTLAIFQQVLPGLPVLVAANRDEYLARPTMDPMLLEKGPEIVGGRDEVAGGSWLTLSETGLIVGVLNRRTDLPADSERSSRGELCLELARCSDAGSAATLLSSTPPGKHNPFNILVADSAQAFVAQNRAAGTAVEELSAGLHLLTNLDVDDHTCPRISHSTQHFAEAGAAFLEDRDRGSLLVTLREVLSDHRLALDDRQPTDQLCIHSPAYGTRSSSILHIDDSGRPGFLHAAGPPCETDYERVPLGPAFGPESALR